MGRQQWEEKGPRIKPWVVPDVQTEQKEQSSRSEEENPEKVVWKKTKGVPKVGQVRCSQQKAFSVCCCEDVAFTESSFGGAGWSGVEARLGNAQGCLVMRLVDSGVEQSGSSEGEEEIGFFIWFCFFFESEFEYYLNADSKVK